MLSDAEPVAVLAAVSVPEVAVGALVAVGMTVFGVTDGTMCESAMVSPAFCAMRF